MNKLNVILSVDWEPDHGPWKWRETEVDYGGVIRGTPAFCSLLDELGISCTWFVETSYDPKRDLPGRFPEVVRQLALREQDEVGLHIHWRRPSPDNTVFYETSDVVWVNAQLDHGVRQLETLGARPRSFRSGALLHVKELPRMLNEKGFLVDSSTLWGKANRLKADQKHFVEKPFRSRLGTFLQRAFAAIPEPYFTDDREVERRGNSGIVEFPITYSLFDSRRSARDGFCRYLRYKTMLGGQVRYLMLFFHIDELTRTSTGPDRRTEPDPVMLKHFRRHLGALQASGARFVTCAQARKRWLHEFAAEAEEAHDH